MLIKSRMQISMKIYYMLKPNNWSMKVMENLEIVYLLYKNLKVIIKVPKKTQPGKCKNNLVNEIAI